MNICRLPNEEAFLLAYEMAAANPDTTAFFRFADFENYYPRRMKQDEYLYDLFVSLGGSPKEKPPLSFALQTSAYLGNWFGNDVISKVKLQEIPSEFISFTLDDSMAAFSRDGKLTMYTKEMILDAMSEYDGAIDDFMNEIMEKHY